MSADIITRYIEATETSPAQVEVIARPLGPGARWTAHAATCTQWSKT